MVQCTMAYKYQPSEQGFSLTELALVLVIIGFLMSTVASVGSVQIEQQRINDTHARMEFVAAAIDQYARENHHIPCPADPQARYNDPWAGAGRGSDSFAITIHIWNPATAAAPIPPITPATSANNCFSANLVAAGTNVRIGAVPYKDLGISAASAEDAWGNKLTYVVDQDLTNRGTAWDMVINSFVPGFLNNGRTDFNPPNSYEHNGTMSEIRIVDSGNNNISTITSPVAPPAGEQAANNAAYVIISHGPNGGRAWPARQPAGGTRNPDTPNPLEQENTNDDVTFRIMQPTSGFDDLVLYKTKWQIANDPW